MAKYYKSIGMNCKDSENRRRLAGKYFSQSNLAMVPHGDVNFTRMTGNIYRVKYLRRW